MFRKINVIVAVIMMMFIVSFLSVYTYSNHTYSTTMVVVAIDDESMGLADFNGNMWVVDDVEDWQIGDYATVTMYDKFTENIFDDEIIKIRYSGWLDGNWGELFPGHTYFTTNEIPFEED